MNVDASGAAIILPDDGNVRIVLAGKTTLINVTGVALTSASPAAISGSGSLSATGTFSGILCTSDLTIESGTVTAVGTNTDQDGSTGIACMTGTLTISGGTVNATGGAAAMLANTSIVLNGTEIKIPTGVSIGNGSHNYATILNANGAYATTVTIGPKSASNVGGGSSSTTTTTVKNEDGSTTTTTTNTATGTVTETTKNTDGSTVTVETKKDGSSTTTDKAASGVTTVTKTDKDGAATETTVTVPTTVTDKVQVQVPTELGKADGTVSVEVTYKDGTKETVVGSYSGGKVSVNVTGSATIEILDDFVPLATALPFTDVPASAWYYDELLYAYNFRLFSGTSVTTFNPNANMTRQQMWMVLARMAGENPANMDAAQAWATDNGISDGSNPTNNVTREQFVTLLWRFAGSPKMEGEMGLAGYDDAASIADYAAEAMLWAVKNQIISGTSNTTLSPEKSASRAQVAVILARFKQR